MNRESHKDNPIKIQAGKTKSTRVQKNCFTQVSDENGGTVSNKFSQEISKIGSCILGVLSQLDEFDRKPQAWAHSGPVSETYRNLNPESGVSMS